MAQLFPPTSNIIARVTIFGALIVVGLLGGVLYELGMSPYYTNVNVTREQPVPFSHKHHAGELGIDCRYCHTTVEKSSFAGVPPTQTCMTCHSQIWTNSSMLEPVRFSYRTDKSIAWTRVNALPQFVYFDHSIHINKGVGCTTCHGQVAQMPLMFRAQTLYMSFCLDCHRQPEKYIRKREDVFDPNWAPGPNQLEEGRKLKAEYHIQDTRNIQTCSTCHR
jgi:Cytochrome c7 and related cytochrome c/Class III cytochrome C family